MAYVIDREAIYSAFFAWLQANVTPGTFNTVGRRLLPVDQVYPPMQPALFQQQTYETVEQRRGVPPKWKLYLDLYVYTYSADPATTPAIALNQAMNAIDAALAPPPGLDVQTLGGLVSHAWISGHLPTDELVLGEQAIAVMPVEIFVNY